LNKFVQDSLGIIGFISAFYGIYQLSEPVSFILGGGFLIMNSLLSSKK